MFEFLKLRSLQVVFWSLKTKFEFLKTHSNFWNDILLVQDSIDESSQQVIIQIAGSPIWSKTSVPSKWKELDDVKKKE